MASNDILEIEQRKMDDYINRGSRITDREAKISLSLVTCVQDGYALFTSSSNRRRKYFLPPNNKSPNNLHGSLNDHDVLHC